MKSFMYESQCSQQIQLNDDIDGRIEAACQNMTSSKSILKITEDEVGTDS